MSKETKSTPESSCTDQAIISYLSSDRQVQALNFKFNIRHGKESQIFKISRQVASAPPKESVKPSSAAAKTPVKARIIRIYLVGHCSPGSQSLYGDFDEEYSIKAVAEHVISCLKKINDSLSFSSDSSIKISIIACDAGIGLNSSPSGSFAEGLYRELHARGINADVVARVTGVHINRSGFNFWKETTRSKNELKTEHHQPGSKVIFTAGEEGQSIYKDAYAVSWKAKLLSTIQDCATKTNVQNKSEKLNKLHSSLKNKSEEFALQELERIVQQKDSFIDSHLIIGLGRKTHTRIVFETLMHEGIKFIRNPQTIAPTTML